MSNIEYSFWQCIGKHPFGMSRKLLEVESGVDKLGGGSLLVAEGDTAYCKLMWKPVCFC